MENHNSFLRYAQDRFVIIHDSVRVVARWLAGMEWLALLVVLPVVMFITPETTPVLLLLPALWLVRKMGEGRFVPATPLDGANLLLLLMVLVSYTATFDVAFSLAKIAGITFGVAVFYGVAAAAGRSLRHLLAGVAVFLGSGAAVAGVGLLGTQWSGNKLPGLSQATALLPQGLVTLPGAAEGFNPNQLAGVLLWPAPVALAIALTLLHPVGGQRRQRWAGWLLALALSWGVALFLTGALLLTQSRAGLLGLAAAGAFVLLGSAWLRSRRLGTAAVVLLALGVGGAVYAYRQASLAPWLPGGAVAVESGVTPVSLDGRLEIWSRAIYGIQDFPLTGMGIGTFRRVVHVLYPLFLISPETDIAHAHNHLLQTGLDLGIPGLIAYLALWLGAAAMLWQTWRRAAAVWTRALAIGFGGALLGYFVYGAADAVALGAKPGFLFWWLLGLITVNSQQSTANSQQPTANSQQSTANPTT